MSKKSLFRGTWETWEATCNMGNGPKHCWNLNDSTFTIFIDHWERNSGWKNFSEWYGNSLDCLLANWLPMTGIVLLTKAIHCNMFRCNYLRNKNYFLHFFFFFFAIFKFTFNFEIFQKRDDRHTWCIFELKASEKRG